MCIAVMVKMVICILKINELEELRVFIRSESGVRALALTPPDVLETFRTLERLQPRFETALWLGPFRTASEYFPVL